MFLTLCVRTWSMRGVILLLAVTPSVYPQLEPSDVVATPSMPSHGGPLRLFGTKEENSVPVQLKCESYTPVQLQGTIWRNFPEEGELKGWQEFNVGWKGVRQHVEKVSALNCTLTQAEVEEGDRIRYNAKFVTKLHIFDTAKVKCIAEGIQEAQEQVFYAWNISAHDVGPTITGPGYLKFGMNPVRQPGQDWYNWNQNDLTGDEGSAPVLQCYSEVYMDANLRMVPCTNVVQCNHLQPCLERGTGECGSLVDEGAECWVTIPDTKSCEELQSPTAPGALFECKAGGYSFTQHRWLGLSGNSSYVYRDEDFEIEALTPEIVRIHSEGAGDTFYTRIAYNFTCITQPWWSEINDGSEPNLRFHLDNGTHLELVKNAPPPSIEYPVYGSRWWYTEHVSLTFLTKDVIRVFCSVLRLGTSSKWIQASIPVYVEESTRPQILNPQSERKVYLEADGVERTVDCYFDGKPPPNVTWTREGADGGPISPDPQFNPHVVGGQDKLVLSFPEFNPDLQGAYTCMAVNPLGEASMEFTVSLPVQDKTVWFAVGLALGAFALLLAPAFLVGRHFFFKRRRVLDEVEMVRFHEGFHLEEPQVEAEFTPEPGLDPAPRLPLPPVHGHNWLTAWEHLPFNKQYEISRGEFDLDKSLQLGSGVHGKVLGGTLRREADSPKPVAIKVPQRNCPEQILLALLKELKIMTHLQHENVVSLLGANTAHAAYGRLYILMEFCEEGSIEQYFTRNRCYYIEKESQSPEPSIKSHYMPLSACVTPKFNAFHLRQWCLQVTSGMRFLASVGVVHRDLAARNVLLTANLQAKVSDFGLSRQLYGNPTYEQKTTEMELPCRWMAPECFQGSFSTPSDVWAFGVLVWEVYSLGAMPYEGISFKDARGFAELLRGGLRIRERLEARMPPGVFEMLEGCWSEEPRKRPTFGELEEFFEKLPNFSNK